MTTWRTWDSLCFLLLCSFPLTTTVAQSPSSDLVRSNPAEGKLCGADCLFVTLCYFGRGPNTYSEMLSTMGPVPEQGYSLQELCDTATDFGLFAECVLSDIDSIRELPNNVKAVVLLNEPGHYLLVRSIRTSKEGSIVDLEDPRGPIMSLSEFELARRWDGHAFLVSNKPLALTKWNGKPYIISAFAITFLGLGLVAWRRRHT